MKLYVDSSLTEACWQFDDELPIRMTHIPPPKTHNIGEYLAVENALSMAIMLVLKNLQVYTDSQLVVGQVTKGWKCNVPHLKEHIITVQSLLRQSESTLSWIPREENPAGKELERRSIKMSERGKEIEKA